MNYLSNVNILSYRLRLFLPSTPYSSAKDTEDSSGLGFYQQTPGSKPCLAQWCHWIGVWEGCSVPGL